MTSAPGPGQHGAVFVLFHPSEDQVRALIAVAANGEHARPSLVAVDNSPAPDRVLHERLRGAGITVLDNRNAGGLSGAFNRGAEHVLAQGLHGFYLFDQDSIIPSDFFVATSTACAVLGDGAYIVGPQIHESRLNMLGLVWPPTFGPNEPVGDLVPTQFVISSGSLVSAAAFNRTGPFREDYFIESIDIEYALRARHLGIGVYVNTAATLVQTTGEITQFEGGIAVNHTASRCYYRSRNYLDASRRHQGKRGAASGLRHAAQQLRVVLRWESHKGAKAGATLMGALDGAFGRLGTLEERHPRLARRWQRR